MSDAKNRHERGVSALESITGGTGGAVVEGLKDIAPDLAEWIISFSYGDVMSRPGLDLAVFAGFPSAINALNIAREVFKERGVSAGA